MGLAPRRATLKAEYEKLHKAVLAIVREDAVCRRLMTVPGVGPKENTAAMQSVRRLLRDAKKLAKAFGSPQ
jgi:transposase